MMMDLKKIFVIGIGGFTLICLGLFYHLTSSLSNIPVSESNKLDYAQVKQKLDTLEAAVMSHRRSMKEVENMVLGDGDDTQRKSKQISEDWKLDNEVDKLVHDVGPRPGQLATNGHLISPIREHGGGDQNQCSAAVGIGAQAHSDINMLSVYEELKFDNPDGGVWKQGWDIKIDESRFTSEDKLKVFVIPHSHNDPGWLKTFERYFEDQTRHILDSMLRELTANSEVKFIWAEISYFDKWWTKLDKKDKEQVKTLISNGQLEFVTGGWVMPDESSSHYYSIITQLIEGNQWLLNHLDYVPKNGWSIDPFGMSPTTAYVLKRSGFKNMLIQRTHYSIKKQLSKLQQLEFKWRQIWDNQGGTDMLTHMLPFYSYDVPHTCGPNPKVCCQFDFKRMRGVSGMSCPWNVPPVPIQTRNVRERSLLLLDQYKKKAMLYKTNSLLIPLGDDFRWEDHAEWKAQTENYLKIMDYINSQPELHAEVKFGTLDDYFASLESEIENGKFSPSVLTGDFFTYADRDDHYWSGYFTSRPFHKATDRQLMHFLRSAHIAYTLVTAELSRKYSGDELQRALDSSLVNNLLGKLIQSSRTLSLFQHHDGIAGTSKDHVMVDYGNKLLDALNGCNHVMQQSIYILTHLHDSTLDLNKIGPEIIFNSPSKSRDAMDSLENYELIILDDEFKQKIVSVYNSVARTRNQLVTFHVSTYNVKVYDLDGKSVEVEILPVFEDKTIIKSNVFELTFIAELGPLSIRNYKLVFERKSKFSKPEIMVLNPSNTILQDNVFPINELQGDEELEISNEYISAQFDNNGFVKAVRANGENYPLRITMNQYGAKRRSESSGLYLFIPDGPASQLALGKPFVRIIRGKFQSYVEVWLPQVKHRITLYNVPGSEKYSMEVKNIVDIRREENFELMMKFESNIESGDTFYTDLNGFHMIKRKMFSKIPIQGNYYPFPSAAYIEDPKLRLTILSRQPLGGSSLSSGEFEVIMDRRLMQDDNRGAGQGAKDNLITENKFRLLFEVPQCEDKLKENSPPMLSLQSNIAAEDLLNPFKSFVAVGQDTLSDENILEYRNYNATPSSSSTTIPCDIQLVDTIPLQSYSDSLDDSSYIAPTKTGILVRRIGFDGQFLGGTPLPNCVSEESELGKIKLNDIFGTLIQPQVTQTTLNFIHQQQSSISSNEPLLIKPMEVYAFEAHYTNSRN